MHPFLRTGAVALLINPILGAADATRAADLTPLSIGVSLNVVFGPVFVLGDKTNGIASKHGLDVSLKMFPTGVASMEAAISGNLDLPIMNSAVALPILAGGKACFRSGINFTDFGSLGIVGRRDIASVNGLAGKKVGTVAGAIGNTALHFWLDMHSIPRDQVTIVNVQPQDMAPALVRGDVDAIIWSEPIPSQAMALIGADKVHVIGNVNEAYRDTVPLSVTCSWHDKHGDVAMKKLIAAWIEAVDHLRANPEEAARLTGAALRQEPASILKRWQDGGWLEAAWPADLNDAQVDMLLRNVDYLISVKRMEAVPDLSRWISSRWLTEVAPERVRLSRHRL